MWSQTGVGLLAQ